LHGKTSREMFQGLWPPVPADEVPITSITNGVHGRTWVSSQMDDLYSKYVSPAWDDAGPEEWTGIMDAREDELWRAREQGREALVDFVRDRLRSALHERGVSVSDAAWVDEVLDPRFLIVGFSRRFATYKRATLLLSQPERLRALLLDEHRPLQLLFAGKAHPADDLGKEMIAQIVRFSRDPAVRHRIAFVENYDIPVARVLYQGSDVWLNTPRRPMEASGTSGEKAALNGALNLSILDGWWDEMFDGANGWAISSAEGIIDVAHRDEVEANSLFEILERQILPLYYERSGGRYPRGWVSRVKASLASLGPKVMASRMVKDYMRELYEPTALQADSLAAGAYARARALAAWKQRILEAWPAVKVLDVEPDDVTGMVDLGGERSVSVSVELGTLTPDDVAVELLHGPVVGGDELTGTDIVRLALAPTDDRSGPFRYEGTFPCDQAGRHGYTVRIVPAHPDLVQPVELGCIAWA
ncbi:MAG TPA: alpha-glucan family phosphorylase, partial [Acidimicrobiales bacterium]|nr:alpha-glucan family phosphorylase [Acidimicrobiales bacterium]